MPTEVELKKLLDRSQEQMEALDSANQALLETLSHDLRTPLNSIIGFADMMDQEILGPMKNSDYRTYAEDICKSGRTMLEILNDLLDRQRFDRLKKTEKDFRHIIELAPDLICVCRDGLIKMINPAGANMLGVWPVETLYGRPFKDFLDAEFHELFNAGLSQLIAVQKRVPVKLKRTDAIDIDVELAAVEYQDDEDENSNDVMLMARDVSERNRSVRALAAREEHIRKIMDTVIDGILTVDDGGRIETANPAAGEIFFYNSDDLIGQQIQLLTEFDIIHFYDASRRDTGGDLTRDQSSALAAGMRQEILGRRKDGTPVPIDLSISAFRDGVRRVFICTVRDITERKLHEENLRALVTQDPLTKMPNRLLFNERLEMAITRADKSGTHFAVIFVDLDHFKNINDAMGHIIGDKVIQEAGTRLQNCMGEQDTVAHMSGDEFNILIDNVDNQEDLCEMADTMLSCLRVPFVIDGKEIFTSGSLGVVMYPDQASSLNQLMRNADTAANQAKKEGRDHYQFYSEKLSAAVERRMAVESALRRALENDEFVVYYQPKIDLETRKLIGAEALLRWDSAILGRINPDEFIPVAEETGLIIAVGEWVLRQACWDAVEWQKVSDHPIHVGVNLSAMQFLQGDLALKVDDALLQSGLDPKLLDLELTESMLVMNPEETIQTLDVLKSKGISISMDDFGTGYSSLSYLTRFPLDSLKVDRAFVINLPDDQDAVAIARAIVSMAQNLNLNIVAEGIETGDHVRFLHGLGCNVGQGYLFSPPVDGDRFIEMIRHNDFDSVN